MKQSLIILLFELCATGYVFSQSTLQEFVIEEDDSPQVLIVYPVCTPDVGVIVFYTAIPDLNFSMPDTPGRLKNVSAFDKVNNRYVLCVQPTDTKIGGIMQYSIAVTGAGYKPMPAFMVSGINAGIAQYFNIKLKEDWKSAFESLKEEINKLKSENGGAAETVDRKPVAPVYKEVEETGKELFFVFKGVEKNNNSSVELYLNNKWIGETDSGKRFQFRYTDPYPGKHECRVVWAGYEWKGKINTAVQTDFEFEYKKKKTGFGYEYRFELVK